MMKRLWVPGLLGLFAFTVTANAQTPTPGALLNKLSLTYRFMSSFRGTANWTRKVGSKEMTATINLAAQRPNKYLLDVKGEKVNTFIVSDGATLTAYRPDRNAYTRTKAPVQLMKANVLEGIDLPTPGARIITFLMEGHMELTDRLQDATVSAAQPYGDKFAWIFSFRLDSDYDAKLTITTDDYLIRRASLTNRDGEMEIDEKYVDIETGKPIADTTFAWKAPDGAKLVAVLPKLETPIATSGKSAPGFTLQTVDGRTVTLASLKGKIVLLNFFFVD